MHNQSPLLKTPIIYSYHERAQRCNNRLARTILQLMEEKKTNLALAADVTHFTELYALIHAVGPFICMLKTHIDILSDFDATTAETLSTLARQYNFVIFEDRKFADIGNTAQQQYAQGLYRIVEWADVVNAHPLPGSGLVEGLKQVGKPHGRGLLLIGQMSSANNLITPAYTQATIAMAQAHADFVVGFITRERLCDDPGMLHCTPGVQLQEGTDALGQRYATPNYIIGEKQCDIIIVGRGIYEASDPADMAKRYRDAGWQAYQSRTTHSCIKNMHVVDQNASHV